MADSKLEGLIKQLQEKWGNRGCPLCGKGPWNVQNSVFQLLEYSSGGLSLGGPVVPVVPVVCGNCGNTVLINAILAGVVKPAHPDMPPPPEKKEGDK